MSTLEKLEDYYYFINLTKGIVLIQVSIFLTNQTKPSFKGNFTPPPLPERAVQERAEAY